MGIGFLKMFDKLDDIIYEPVKTICDACRQPLKNMDAANERKMVEVQAKMQRQLKDFEVELELKRQRGEIENKAEERRLNAEIDEMLMDKDFERDMKKAEFIKQYQEDMIKLGATVNEALGRMSVELRERTHMLVLEKTQQYMNLQIEAKERMKNDLRELNDLFGDDEESKKMMRQVSFEQVKIIMDASTKFIDSMSKDMESMTANIDAVTRNAIDNANRYLSSVDVKQTSNSIGYNNIKQINQ